MKEETKIYERGLEEYPKSEILWQNIIIILIFAIAFWGMYSIQISGIPILSLIYLGYVIVVLVFVLRKHLCTSCYYYDKWCTVGWGKLASRLFKKNSGNFELGGKIAGIFWPSVMIIPVLAMAISLILNFSTTVLILLIAFLVLNAANFSRRKKSCGRCKMRFICPGSAAKKM